jgi:hypothetical protein
VAEALQGIDDFLNRALVAHRTVRQRCARVTGALEKAQPVFETWETLAYLGGGCFFAWLTLA